MKRKIIKIDRSKCDGCGLCINACAEGAIQLVDGKAKLVSDKYCDGLGDCIGECPQGAIEIIEREAEPFDESAVNNQNHSIASSAGFSCPSAKMHRFSTPKSSRQEPVTDNTPQDSLLSHWPVQLRLINPQASFLKDADILLVADCVPVSTPGFQHRFIKDKVVMMSCPKFDDPMESIRRMAEIFKRNTIRSVTVLKMEVPCCSKLAALAERALDISGKDIPVETVTISLRGEVLKKEKVNA